MSPLCSVLDALLKQGPNMLVLFADLEQATGVVPKVLATGLPRARARHGHVAEAAEGVGEGGAGLEQRRRRGRVGADNDKNEGHRGEG